MDTSGLAKLADNFFNLAVLGEYYPQILAGLLVTAKVAVVVVTSGIAVGFGLAIVRCAGVKFLNVLIVAYVDFFRTLPQLVIIIFVYFALPYADISLSPFAATALSLGFVLSAFSAEIFWASILTTPSGQSDAGYSLGLRKYQVIGSIIVPQAVRIAIPMLANRSIAITKGTALGSAISLPEILGTAQSAVQMAANPSPLTLAAVLYVLLFLPLVIGSRYLESRYQWTR